MNKYCVFILFISVNFMAYGMQQHKQLKDITNNSQSMTRQEVKSQSVMTEFYNHIPEQTTNKAVAERMADLAHRELRGILNNTKPTSPTNKFIPRINLIQQKLHTVISPTGKQKQRKQFPDNITTLSKRIQDIVTLSLPLYDPTSPSATTLREIEEEAITLENQAISYAQELQDSNKENVNPNVSRTKQQSLHSFLGGTSPKKTISPRKRRYKRKDHDIDDNKSIKDFFEPISTKKTKHESPPSPIIILDSDSSEMVTESANQQQSSPEIIIDDDDSAEQTQPELSGHQKLAALRCKSTAARKLNF